jgi:hypothetical protein
MNEKMPIEGESEGKMDVESALLEAKMMKVKIQEAVGHEPTVADYDEALAEVEEMKKEAEEEAPRGKVDKTIFNVMGFLYRIAYYGRKEDAHFFDTAKEKLEQLKADAEKLE